MKARVNFYFNDVDLLMTQRPLPFPDFLQVGMLYSFPVLWKNRGKIEIVDRIEFEVIKILICPSFDFSLDTDTSKTNIQVWLQTETSKDGIEDELKSIKESLELAGIEKFS